MVRAFVDAGGGLAAAGYCSTDGGTVAVANSAGQRLVGRYTAATLEGIHQLVTAGGAGLATQASSRFSDLDGAGSGARAAAAARQGVDPVDIEPGEYEVVLEAEAVANVVDFLASYGFNAKSYNEGESFVRLGDTQFDAAVSLCDDATDPRAIGLTFDVEGTPKGRVDLVRAGVSTALVHDRRSAKEAGGAAASTGHAVPGSDTWGPYPANLFLAGQNRSLDDLIASVERGLLVTELNYCRVLDPKTMVVTGLTRNGTFLIEGGRVAKPVSNLRFTQSFAGALAPGQVLGLGRARFARSNEGATVHVPDLHLAAWNVTGGARG